MTTLVQLKKKFMATLVEFEKIECDDKTRYDTLYSNSKAELIISDSDMDDASIYPTIISDIQKALGKDSGWIIDSGIDQVINISKYNPLPCSSYAKLPIELGHPRKDLINIENIDDGDDDDDNKCFKWCLVRYLYPADHHQARITKANKDFEKDPDFKVITFPVKIRDIHKIEKTNSFAISVFGYESKLKIQSIYQKNAVKKNMLVYDQ